MHLSDAVKKWGAQKGSMSGIYKLYEICIRTNIVQCGHILCESAFLKTLHNSRHFKKCAWFLPNFGQIYIISNFTHEVRLYEYLHCFKLMWLNCITFSLNLVYAWNSLGYFIQINCLSYAFPVRFFIIIVFKLWFIVLC